MFLIYNRYLRSHYQSPSAFVDNPELPQASVCVFTAAGLNELGQSLDTLLHGTDVWRSPFPDLTVVSIKWLSRLERHQAKEITPYEIGDSQYQSSIDSLTGGPVAMVVVYGVSVFEIAHAGESHFNGFLSAPNLSHAFRIMCMFFHDSELCLPASKNVCLPEPNSGLTLLKAMTLGPQPISSLALVKPDGIPFLAKILHEFEQSHFTIVGLQMHHLTESEARELVAISPDAWGARGGDDILAASIAHLTTGPVVAVSVHRVNAVASLLSLAGDVDPAVAVKQQPLAIRASFGAKTPVLNRIHVSASYASAVLEQAIFFKGGVCRQPVPLPAYNHTSFEVRCSVAVTLLIINLIRKPHVRSTASSSLARARGGSFRGNSRPCARPRAWSSRRS